MSVTSNVNNNGIDSNNLFTRLQAGVGTIVNIAQTELEHCSETDTRFSLGLNLDPASLSQILADLAPISDLLDITLEYRIQHGSGSASLSPQGLTFVEWHEDSDLNPPDLDPNTAELFSVVAVQLSHIDKTVQADNWAIYLHRLAQAGAEVELFLRIFLNKQALIQKLDWPDHIRYLMYISADKFLRQLKSKSFREVWDLLIPGSQDTLVLMLGDALGMAIGPNIRIYGRDSWAAPDYFYFPANQSDRQKVSRAINFRDTEGYWEINKPGLTPYHLHIENLTLNRPDILKMMAHLRNSLAVAYLADRTQANNGTLKCQFTGHSRTWITVPWSGDTDDGTGSIFNLFNWAYENASSDKLGIARQIIALQLADNDSGNYTILVEKAADMLSAAKSNFQIFLRRSVELYFDKRLKVSQFIQKFSEEMGAGVSGLTSELISNLYRTIGVIIGVVIAMLVDSDNTPVVVYWTALLYLIYISFILIYLLPATYLRFRNKVYEYRHSLAELRDVLSIEEISRLQGNSFHQARSFFLIYFTVTNLVYALLGLVAYMLISIFL